MVSIFDDYLKSCETAARAAGAELVRWMGRAEVRTKGRHDFVTEADLASQELVRRILAERYPDHALLGEEGASPAANGESEYRWIVDPLDGTTNYVHGFPHFAVSLALERQGEALVGVVFDPLRNECFAAARGRGATLNGEPIRTRAATMLSESLAVCGFPPNVQRESPDFKAFMQAIFECQSIRRTGSAALNLCYVANGRCDLFWSYATKIWDVAAGALIVSEAGGVVRDPSGGPFQLSGGKLLATANESLFGELLAMMKKAGN